MAGIVTTKIPPLDWQTPIVGKDGTPSDQFIRIWQQNFQNAQNTVLGIDGKADKTTVITAGVGLTGGGDLSSNRTIDLEDTAVTPGVYGDATHVPQITVDQQGRLTDVVDVPISGGGGGGGFTAIQTITLAAQAASFDFTSIPSTYKDLLIVGTVRGTDGNVTVTLHSRFNGDTGSNYDGEQQHYFDSGALTAQYTGQAAARVAAMAGGGATANFCSGFTLDIPTYNSPFYKASFSKFSTSVGTGGFSQGIGQYSGNWRDVTAINQITLLPSSGLFEVGSEVTLYGRG